MSIIKWAATKELNDMKREMDKLFEEFFSPVAGIRRSYVKPGSGVITPIIEMFDRENDIVIKADMPGVNKEDIDLLITEDTLILKGEYKKTEEIKEESYYLKEKTYGNFLRNIALPSGLDTEKVKATLKNGVLEIVFAKKEEAKIKERKIEVS